MSFDPQQTQRVVLLRKIGLRASLYRRQYAHFWLVGWGATAAHGRRMPCMYFRGFAIERSILDFQNEGRPVVGMFSNWQHLVN